MTPDQIGDILAVLRARVAAGGWDWPADQQDRLAASVERHLQRVEADITEWLAACDEVPS